jgi:hypothetical protein
MNARLLAALNLASLLAAAPAAGPAIGVAVGNGEFRVDGSPVAGNTTLFDGSKVETGAASSRLRLGRDTRLELSTATRVTVFRDRARLESGAGEFATGSGYQVEARGLRVSTAAGAAIARVRMDAGRAVLIAAVNGPVRVFSGSGALVASVSSGATLRFEAQAQPEGVFNVGGCLLRKAGKYILVDQTTKVVVELRGDDALLSPEAGNRVQVAGKAEAGAQPVAGASQVVRVEKLEEIGPGGCVAAAAAIGADSVTRTPPPASAPAAKSGHTGAIIAGVAVAAGGGVAAAVLAAGKSQSKSP